VFSSNAPNVGSTSEALQHVRGCNKVVRLEARDMFSGRADPQLPKKGVRSGYPSASGSYWFCYDRANRPKKPRLDMAEDSDRLRERAFRIADEAAKEPNYSRRRALERIARALWRNWRRQAKPGTDSVREATRHNPGKDDH
jgi:hypothetical protein